MNAYSTRKEIETENELEILAAARKMIVSALDHSAAPKIMLVPEEADGKVCPQLRLPPKALRFLAEILQYMAKKEEIYIIPHSKEFSTQEAADYLNVSRPYVVKLIDENKLKATKVGTHRRIAFVDLKAYQNEMLSDANAAIKDFSSEFNGED